MNKFEWGNIKNPKVNIDNFHDIIIGSMQYRNTMQRLASQLHQEGKDDKAVKVLDKSLEEFTLYYELGETEKANHLLNELATDNFQMLKYVNSLSPKFADTPGIQREENISFYTLQKLFEAAYNAGQKDIAENIKNKVESIVNPNWMRPAPATHAPIKDSAPEVEIQ